MPNYGVNNGRLDSKFVWRCGFFRIFVIVETNHRLTSPYRQGADNGFVLGAYLSALFFASAFALKVQFLGLLSTALIIAIPVIIFMMLRRTWIRDQGMSLFSSLWMQGIVAFACSGIISGCVAYIYIRWVEPDWLTSQVQQMITMYQSVQGGEQVAQILETVLKQKLLPSPIQMVIQMLWLEIFCGSVVSLIATLIVRTTKPRQSAGK